uniref:ZF-HD dimerization-type domain-containing protein n=1 Tax=Nelumbo nucifera TaxID=4432 RepID=A0A822XUF4_NELNU|nr:TPA_asm: hypothetical protein HUJ06_024264 [Nelumbo nucifera]
MEGDNINDAYRECRHNHAASLGSYATDGCGELTTDETTPGLMCEACGCHHNFHQKVIVLEKEGGRGGSNTNQNHIDNNRVWDAVVVEIMDLWTTRIPNQQRWWNCKCIGARRGSGLCS